MKKTLLCLIWLLCTAVLANATEPTVPKKNSVTADANNVMSSHMLMGLNNSLNNFRLKEQLLESIIAPDLMLDLEEQVSQEAGDDRKLASGLMNFLDSHSDQVKEDLTRNDLVVLPVGLKKKIGDNSTVTLGILKAEFHPTYAELTVFIRLTTPVNSKNSTIKERDLFFGVEGIKITKQGGMSAAGFKAVLLGDYLIPYNEWTVKLKGGIDKSIEPVVHDANRCYIEWNCGEFKEINLAADIVIPRSKLLPCDAAGNVIPAIHGVNPLSALLAGKVNGYYISIYKDEETFYTNITSDTVYKQQVIDAILGKNIDLMIPNMDAAKEGSWIMTLTLNTKMLKKMISKLNPKKVIPVHYGTFEHYVEPLEKIKNLKEERITLLGLGETYQL
ncbi:hypothetical protein EGI22_10575 [Lacihabitans sp. LS3-19]|uniref:MBL fold metallo-hydrolase n=1 Tax=Lacihabitans sp. LS3-19 TaxID=2487335 RepID=UPI0020CDE65D|nr:hypothetical protein [Lacihabitans sp. LS3-19]MCP9768358.1 hypothetical protein [Lacihabitans sp. LS3-19]